MFQGTDNGTGAGSRQCRHGYAGLDQHLKDPRLGDSPRSSPGEGQADTMFPRLCRHRPSPVFTAAACARLTRAKAGLPYFFEYV